MTISVFRGRRGYLCRTGFRGLNFLADQGHLVAINFTRAEARGPVVAK
jgi:hypothetical protein